MDDPARVAKGKAKEQPLSDAERHVRRGSIASIASTTDASSHVSSKHDRCRSRSPDSGGFNRTRSEVTTQSARYGHSRTQSMMSDSTRSQTRRREKAAVGFACLNCKKAHLACDVDRPCKRCVAMGRSSTCSDVPHKRRGRPRLKDTDEGFAGHNEPSRGSRAVGGPSQQQSQHRRQHSRTGSLASPYNHPSYSGMMTKPSWIEGQSFYRRESAILPHNAFPAPMQQPPVAVFSSVPEPSAAYRATGATLIVSTDLVIVRAPPDAQSLFCVPARALEGRTLFELCHSNEDRGILPDLIRALLDEVRMRRLLLQVHEHRTMLYNDLQPYTDEDLLHPLPGATEYPLQLDFLDAHNRIISARVVAVIGARSNDRYVYVLLRIQRNEKVYDKQPLPSYGAGTTYFPSSQHRHSTSMSMAGRVPPSSTPFSMAASPGLKNRPRPTPLNRQDAPTTSNNSSLAQLRSPVFLPSPHLEHSSSSMESAYPSQMRSPINLGFQHFRDAASMPQTSPSGSQPVLSLAFRHPDTGPGVRESQTPSPTMTRSRPQVPDETKPSDTGADSATDPLSKRTSMSLSEMMG